MPVISFRKLAIAFAFASAASQALCAELPKCAPIIEASGVTVNRVEKNGVLVLADGRAIHLEGLLLPQGMKDHAPQFLAEQALGTLTDLAKGRTVTLAVNVPKEDRYGRIRAQVEFPQDSEEPWLQIAMLRRGMARVSIAPDRRECADQLYAAEAEARAKKSGIWAQSFYSVRGPDQLAGTLGTFQIVQGKVLDTEIRNGRAYIEFGPQGKGDLTVTITTDDMETFRDAGVDPRNYAGKTVRVRGFVEQMNGPEIEVASPEAFEVIVGQ